MTDYDEIERQVKGLIKNQIKNLVQLQINTLIISQIKDKIQDTYACYNSDMLHVYIRWKHKGRWTK